MRKERLGEEFTMTKRANGVRVHHKKERWGESLPLEKERWGETLPKEGVIGVKFTMRKKAMG